MSFFQQQTEEGESFLAHMGEKTARASLFIEYYTDPLCSWSWAFEAQWRRLRYEYGDQLQWCSRMGGLLADWRSFTDPLNDIHRSAQMEPQWLQVCECSGMPLDARLWHIDPPDSSYPACLAVKAAERQGQHCAEMYLRRLREAAFLECRNIAREEVLFDLAREVATQRACCALDLAAYAGIGRFPTLIVHHCSGRSIMLVGYRPYSALVAALEHVAPDVTCRPRLPLSDLALSYMRYWGQASAREVAEMLGQETEQAEKLLGTLVAKHKLAHSERMENRYRIFSVL